MVLFTTLTVLITHLSCLGNSLMDSHTGHISTVEGVKSATPSVLHTREILVGLAKNAACFTIIHILNNVRNYTSLKALL